MNNKENKIFWERNKNNIIAIIITILIILLFVFVPIFINYIQGECIQKEVVCYKLSHSFWGKHQDKVDCNSQNWDIKQEECTMYQSR